ncbi:hypothetical protein [Pseudomonas sp. FEN]|uniref:hypothetical protein n=1 Tax=Pseudomonas sp. FEN TaxID=2767468 RepID=UPI001CD4DC96|nr:hypothetical protein [Pseudomonas sp. FEN]
MTDDTRGTWLDVVACILFIFSRSGRRWNSWQLLAAAVLFLVYVVIRDFPHLDERNKLYQQQYGGHFQPRFWTQGVIAIKPE